MQDAVSVICRPGRRFLPLDKNVPEIAIEVESLNGRACKLAGEGKNEESLCQVDSKE
jgi:hypothetical protein